MGCVCVCTLTESQVIIIIVHNFSLNGPISKILYFSVSLKCALSYGVIKLKVNFEAIFVKKACAI